MIIPHVNIFHSLNVPYKPRSVYKSVPITTAIYTNICSVKLIKKNKQRYSIRTQASYATQLIEFSEVLGKSIILFVIFYSTLNWYYYKRLREDIENNENKKNKK